ncbi:hypothetical protein EOL70_00965 [Leucothrix sargassi]|nr:hypothetical protein EOL70_00965 [Leucothrix sargassi]
MVLFSKLVAQSVTAVALSVCAFSVQASNCFPAESKAIEEPSSVLIPAGDFIQGSSAAEREYAYTLDEQGYGHSTTRNGQWYAGEFKRQTNTTPAYHILKTPVTNAQYQQFIRETCHPAPTVSAQEWATYGLNHAYQSTQKYAWDGNNFPAGRGQHPVVLVSHADAKAYAGWLSKKTGKTWRLPIEAEWEKAVRGAKGNIFPWGNTFDARRLNSHDKGAFETTAVGVYPQGASEYGVLDGAGQVFEWTGTPGQSGRWIVKGGSWDDKGCGVCRPAARHSRPEALKHILIGFRLFQAL